MSAELVWSQVYSCSLQMTFTMVLRCNQLNQHSLVLFFASSCSFTSLWISDVSCSVIRMAWSRSLAISLALVPFVAPSRSTSALFLINIPCNRQCNRLSCRTSSPTGPAKQSHASHTEWSRSCLYFRAVCEHDWRAVESIQGLVQMLWICYTIRGEQKISHEVTVGSMGKEQPWLDRIGLKVLLSISLCSPSTDLYHTGCWDRWHRSSANAETIHWSV